MPTYTEDVVRTMRRFFDSLSEKDRRRYAAVEVTKRGHGGIEYVFSVLGCDPKTIRQGLGDLEHAEDPVGDRVRKKGGGPKRLIATWRTLEENFLRVLREDTAGNPMRQEVRRTNLTTAEISERLAELGTPAGRRVVQQLRPDLECWGPPARSPWRSELS